MERRKYIVLIGVLVTALAILISAGCYHHRTPAQKAERVVKHLISTLNLDATQTAKLEKMKEELLAKRPEMLRDRTESFSDIKEMMLSQQIDQARLNARMEKIQAHTNDMIHFISAKFLELHDMLTPEQRTKLVAEMEKYAQRSHGW